MSRPEWQQARAEGQRLRIIELLEKATDTESMDQCPKCGDWFDNLGAHERHCSGPE